MIRKIEGITGTWDFENGKECFISNYIKKIYLSSYKGPVDPLNGIAQCTKTPCDSTEKTTVSCNVAFTENQLKRIEKRST
ncbi:hypothetical protein CRE_20006 [Caenorhabditis remanei]|uniref:Uncharacterized protein n=1 Tax=Caenorhabditis remanei TaxID=31234 RepID=E3NCG2_CAERE|nr:hypothetical protein CRE_20006 [Caenorhabditis remanei]